MPPAQPPTAPGSGPKPLEAVAKPHRPHPQRSRSVGTRPLSPIPARAFYAPGERPQPTSEDPDPTYLNQSRGQPKWKSYPEQFPDESQPDPSYRSEVPVFDAIQGTDRSASPTTTRGHPDPEAPEMDFTLWLSGVGRFGLQVKDIPGSH